MKRYETYRVFAWSIWFETGLKRCLKRCLKQCAPDARGPLALGWAVQMNCESRLRWPRRARRIQTGRRQYRQRGDKKMEVPLSILVLTRAGSSQQRCWTKGGQRQAPETMISPFLPPISYPRFASPFLACFNPRFIPPLQSVSIPRFIPPFQRAVSYPLKPGP